MADALLHPAIFNPAEDGRNPALPACFLSREWKILRDALELAIQTPQQ
jgi:hypothetical protein